MKQPDEEEVRTSSQKRRVYIEEGQPSRSGAVSSYEVLKKKYQFNGSAARAAAA